MKDTVKIFGIAILTASLVVVFNHISLDCGDFLVKFCVASWH